MTKVLKSFLTITSIFALVQSASASEQLYKKVVGVGLVLAQQGQHFGVKEIIPNSPAAQSGKLKVGDLILEVKGEAKANWVKTAGLKMEELMTHMKGEAGADLGLRTYNPVTHAKTEVFLKRVELEVDEKLSDESTMGTLSKFTCIANLSNASQKTSAIVKILAVDSKNALQIVANFFTLTELQGKDVLTTNGSHGFPAGSLVEGINCK